MKIDIFSREIEGMPKNQVETFELIDTITELECLLEDLKNRMKVRKKKKGPMNLKVNQQKLSNLESTEEKKSLIKNEQTLKDLWDNIISSYTL